MLTSSQLSNFIVLCPCFERTGRQTGSDRRGLDITRQAFETAVCLDAHDVPKTWQL